MSGVGFVVLACYGRVEGLERAIRVVAEYPGMQFVVRLEAMCLVSGGFRIVNHVHILVALE
jgi:hypothetical protein